jgi:hypothetical protein
LGNYSNQSLKNGEYVTMIVNKHNSFRYFAIIMIIGVGILYSNSFADESKLPDWIKNIFV